MLELRNVCKQYEALRGSQNNYVLKDLSWQLEAGCSAAITGPSGSGKSTLLNIIGALDRADSGEVILDGKNLSQLTENELALIRNRQIGFVFQLHHLLPQCTLWENVLLPTLAKFPAAKDNAPLKIDSESLNQRARELLERVGLADRVNHRPGQLSGGERQRVAVVRALINKPKLLLADEPTGSLDEKTSQNLTDLLVQLNGEQGVTLIVATHAPDLAERMGRVWQLNNGQLTPRKNNT